MSDSTFSYDGAIIQYESITTSGTYRITADGAQGGSTDSGVYAGGLGALVSGDIYLSAGAELEIIVGEQGLSAPGSNGGAGGGGGSFVIEINNGSAAVNVNEVIAGGGGGVGESGRGDGGNAGSTPGAGSSTGQGSGGAAGVAGAGGGGGAYYGGGGGGFTGGAGSASSAAAGASGSTAGTSFAGGAGGDLNSAFDGGAGGFGGGGGGGAYVDGGGGGGYGGGGGGGGGGGVGGGGGSYDSGTNLNVITGGATSGGNGLVTIDLLCFMQGTLIATPDGERAVEALTIGDLVLTADGATAPVRWIGRRGLHAYGPDGYLRADPLRVMPIRIKAGALAAGLPRRDLLVSPDHALLIDDILIQAGALVNGVSITREHRLPERFTFYHVELAHHALILAEGLPAETFVDYVDRLAFDNWAEHEALYGSETSIAEMPYPRAQSHRQVPPEIRERLLARGRSMVEMPQLRAA
jgi:hypothetical protein